MMILEILLAGLITAAIITPLAVAFDKAKKDLSE